MKKFRIKETVYKNGINEFTVQVKSTYWYGNDFKSDTLENSIRVLISPFLIWFYWFGGLFYEDDQTYNSIGLADIRISIIKKEYTSIMEALSESKKRKIGDKIRKTIIHKV